MSVDDLKALQLEFDYLWQLLAEAEDVGQKRAIREMSRLLQSELERLAEIRTAVEQVLSA